MKIFDWNADKNHQLIKERGLSFEDVLYCIQNDGLLDDIEHWNKGKYPNQCVFIVNIDEYIYLVPYVESTDSLFLKTIIPSRKATKQYLGVK